MRLLFISTMSGFPWGGSEELWASCALHALAQKHQVFISTLKWDERPDKIQKLLDGGAAPIFRIKEVPVPSSLYQRGKRRILRSLKLLPLPQSPYDFSEKFDAVIISQGGTYDIIYEQRLWDFLQVSQTPFFIINQFNFEHLILNEFERKRGKEIFSSAKMLFFVAERNRETAIRQILDPLKNSKVVSNPVNIPDFEIVQYPKTFPLSFACVARLDCKFKGQDMLLEVLSAAKWRNRKWMLNFYGKGPDEAYLQELTRFFELEDKVVFRGHVKNIKEVWESNHILVLPSIGEGTPLSLIEAMVSGRTAVATDVGDNAKFVINDMTGFLSDAPTIKCIDRALEKAWSQQDKWELLGIEAQKFATSHIDKSPGVTLLKEILERI